MELEKVSVLLTGASGLVGRSLSMELLQKGFNVRGFAWGEQFYQYENDINKMVSNGAYLGEGSILDKLALIRNERVRGCCSFGRYEGSKDCC